MGFVTFTGVGLRRTKRLAKPFQRMHYESSFGAKKKGNIASFFAPTTPRIYFSEFDKTLRFFPRLGGFVIPLIWRWRVFVAMAMHVIKGGLEEILVAKERLLSPTKKFSFLAKAACFGRDFF